MGRVCSNLFACGGWCLHFIINYPVLSSPCLNSMKEPRKLFLLKGKWTGLRKHAYCLNLIERRRARLACFKFKACEYHVTSRLTCRRTRHKMTREICLRRTMTRWRIGVGPANQSSLRPTYKTDGGYREHLYFTQLPAVIVKLVQTMMLSRTVASRTSALPALRRAGVRRCGHRFQSTVSLTLYLVCSAYSWSYEGKLVVFVFIFRSITCRCRCSWRCYGSTYR